MKVPVDVPEPPEGADYMILFATVPLDPKLIEEFRWVVIGNVVEAAHAEMNRRIDGPSEL